MAFLSNGFVFFFKVFSLKYFSFDVYNVERVYTK